MLFGLLGLGMACVLVAAALRVLGLPSHSRTCVWASKHGVQLKLRSFSLRREAGSCRDYRDPCAVFTRLLP